MPTRPPLQREELFQEIDRLHAKYGHPGLAPIYGAGNTQSPRLMCMFMNPTARNIAATGNWKGIRAPWIGTKNAWKMFAALGLISEVLYKQSQTLAPSDWSQEFAAELYQSLSKRGVYVTNLAKCTQVDARPLPNSTFEAFIEQVRREITIVRPQHVITFGNIVSSVLLGKAVRVSEYRGGRYELLHVNGNAYRVYPTYYPVGQGMRNMPKAVKRIRHILQ